MGCVGRVADQIHVDRLGGVGVHVEGERHRRLVEVRRGGDCQGVGVALLKRGRQLEVDPVLIGVLVGVIAAHPGLLGLPTHLRLARDCGGVLARASVASVGTRRHRPAARQRCSRGAQLGRVARDLLRLVRHLSVEHLHHQVVPIENAHSDQFGRMGKRGRKANQSDGNELCPRSKRHACLLALLRGWLSP